MVVVSDIIVLSAIAIAVEVDSDIIIVEVVELESQPEEPQSDEPLDELELLDEP